MTKFNTKRAARNGWLVWYLWAEKALYCGVSRFRQATHGDHDEQQNAPKITLRRPAAMPRKYFAPPLRKQKTIAIRKSGGEPPSGYCPLSKKRIGVNEQQSAFVRHEDCCSFVDQLSFLTLQSFSPKVLFPISSIILGLEQIKGYLAVRSRYFPM